MKRVKTLFERQLLAREAYHNALKSEGGRDYREVKKAKTEYLRLIGLD